MTPPPPIGESVRDRVLREFRLKEAAHEEGRRQGRAEASAMYERRLDDMEKKVKAMWDAFCRDETRAIERPDQDPG